MIKGQWFAVLFIGLQKAYVYLAKFSSCLLEIGNLIKIYIKYINEIKHIIKFSPLFTFFTIEVIIDLDKL